MTNLDKLRTTSIGGKTVSSNHYFCYELRTE